MDLCFYLVYKINGVASVASEGSDMNLFADDIALYRVIKTPADYVALQDDINWVLTVNSTNLKYLHFNKTKYRTMLVSRKRMKSCPPPSLLLDGAILTQVSSYKYLGITITSDLSWSPHITILFVIRPKDMLECCIGIFIRIPIHILC